MSAVTGGVAAADTAAVVMVGGIGTSILLPGWAARVSKSRLTSRGMMLFARNLGNISPTSLGTTSEMVLANDLYRADHETGVARSYSLMVVFSRTTGPAANSPPGYSISATPAADSVSFMGARLRRVAASKTLKATRAHYSRGSWSVSTGGTTGGFFGLLGRFLGAGSACLWNT